MTGRTARIAVLIPCYNEAAAIAEVVREFRVQLPQAVIYVYDNLSSDDTAARAAQAGAVVRSERRRGKGNVVRRMFADIEADVYLLVDGDDTYDSGASRRLVETLLKEELDMVSGIRVPTSTAAYKPGHVFGNRLFTGLAGFIFGANLSDMLSGYRVFSRRFVKSFPSTAEGFGIETELVVHAVRLLMPTLEVETKYQERPAGSASKLRTFRDGLRILVTLSALMREERPLLFFSILFAVLASISLILGIPIILEFLRTGLVPRFPTAVAATGLMLLAFLALASGLILDTVTRGRWELKRLTYLSIPGPQGLSL